MSNAESSYPIRAQELAANAFCKTYSASTINDIAAVVTRMRVPQGREFISYAAQSTDVFLILKGRARAVVTSEGGREITYDIIEEGETIGELAAIDGGARSARVLAEDEVELAKFKQRDFLTLMGQHADFAMVVARRLARSARWMSERVREFQAYNVRGRICAELLRLAKGQSNASITISDRDMASRVGTTRENVTKINAGLMTEGAVVRNGREICVRDAARLRSIMLSCELQ